MSVTALGIDPDSYDTGWGIVRYWDRWTRPACLAMGVVSVPKKLKIRQRVQAMCDLLAYWELPEIEIDLIIVEGQTIYEDMKGRNPNALIHVAQVAGAAAAGAVANAAYDTRPRLVIPEPRTWKRQTPKRAHQAHVCRKLDWGFEKKGSTDNGYVVPEFPEHRPVPQGADSFKPAAFKHVMDGVGLAYWGASTSALGRL